MKMKKYETLDYHFDSKRIHIPKPEYDFKRNASKTMKNKIHVEQLRILGCYYLKYNRTKE